MYMAKPVTLNEEAYEALRAAKKNDKESFSQVILRYVPRPIRTFGDLEKHLEALDEAVIEHIDLNGLRRLRDRKLKGNAH